MLDALRRLFERFWVWLGGESPTAETGVPIEPGPGQLIYVVQPGDTLSRIARRFGTSIWILTSLNDLDSPHQIHVRQRLLIPQPGAPLSPAPAPPPPMGELPVEPGPFMYMVRTGDQLPTIARRFGVTVEAIVRANRIEDSHPIQPGQLLLIPGPEPQAEPEPTPGPEPLLTPPLEPGPLVPTSPVPEPELAQGPLPVSEPESLPTTVSPLSEPETEPLPSPAPVLEPRPEPLPTSKPEPSPTPFAPPEPEPKPRPSAGHDYMVRPGDTLTAIAKRFNVTLRAIIEANAIEDPNLIRPGQRLVIPSVAALPQISNPKSPISNLPPIPWPNDALRGIYVSYFALGDPARRRHVMDILSKTEINALVIDVKADRGWISCPTEVTLAHAIGAAQPTARDFDELMDLFKANGVYTIARIVTFRDDLLAGAHPEWAVQREGGGVWHDQLGLAWSDPFVQAAWEYNTDLAEEAARRGFDEIQFDCVRFPASSREGAPHFSQPLTREMRVAAITGFLRYAHGRLAPLGVRLAAAVSGYACWRQDDTLIGQNIERMAQYLDVLCPMLYPSTFGAGIPGYPYAIAYPYEIVYESVRRAVGRVEPLGCQVRPWIQDFPDTRFDKRSYGPGEIQAQMQGSFDGKGSGYMAWDPQVKYTIAAYLVRK